MSQRKAAFITIAVAVVVALLLGVVYAGVEHVPVWQGIYCTWMTALTVGGDVSPTGGAGHLVLAFAATLVIPLLAATFSLFTSLTTNALTRLHIVDAERRLKLNLENRLEHHFGKLKEVVEDQECEVTKSARCTSSSVTNATRTSPVP